MAIAPHPLPEGRALRIVALGTSLTARGTWPDDLAARLSACLALPVEVTRLARPGATIAWGGDPAQVAAVIAAEPDAILVEFAINDADLRDGLPRAEADARAAALLAGLAAARPDAARVEMTMSPAHGLRGLLRPGLAARYADVAARAARDGHGAIDLHRRWLALPRAARGLGDGLHPDPAVAAAVIVPPLAAYLAAGFGATCPEAAAPTPS